MPHDSLLIGAAAGLQISIPDPPEIVPVRRGWGPIACENVVIGQLPEDVLALLRRSDPPAENFVASVVRTAEQWPHGRSAVGFPVWPGPLCRMGEAVAASPVIETVTLTREQAEAVRVARYGRIEIPLQVRGLWARLREQQFERMRQRLARALIDAAGPWEMVHLPSGLDVPAPLTESEPAVSQAAGPPPRDAGNLLADMAALEVELRAAVDEMRQDLEAWALQSEYQRWRRDRGLEPSLEFLYRRLHFCAELTRAGAYFPALPLWGSAGP